MAPRRHTFSTMFTKLTTAQTLIYPVVRSASVPDITGTSISIGVPIGASIGDKLVAIVFHRSTLSVPTGWVLAHQTAKVGPYQRVEVFTKDFDGIFPGTVTFAAGSSGRMGVILLAVKAEAYPSSINSSTTYAQSSLFAPAAQGHSEKPSLLVVASSAVYNNAATGTLEGFNYPYGFSDFSGPLTTADFRLAAVGKILSPGQNFDLTPGFGSFLSSAEKGICLSFTMPLRLSK